MHSLRISLALLFFLSEAFLSGCKDCNGEGGEMHPLSEVAAEPTAAEQLASRVEARKLDRTKAYPKDADGRIACGTDLDCFVIQAEHCTPTSVTHDQVAGTYGIEQHVAARYDLLGTEAGKCRFVREVTSTDVTLHAKLVKALLKQGKTEADLESLRARSLEVVRANNPARQECWFTPEQVLLAAVDVADGKYKVDDHPVECRDFDTSTQANPSEPAEPAEEAPKPAAATPKPTAP